MQVGLTWAPDIVFDDHEWRMYYVAVDSASGHRCLSIATASTPADRSMTGRPSRSCGAARPRRETTIELDGPTEGPQPVLTPETDH